MSTRRTILVVDDNPVSRELSRRSLEKSGYAVVLAVDGREAVIEYENSMDRLDAILMDIQMPVMDGPTAIARIRAIEKSGSLTPVPVIVLTAQDTLEDRARCEESGCDAYLCRPVSPATLEETIERHIPLG